MNKCAVFLVHKVFSMHSILFCNSNCSPTEKPPHQFSWLKVNFMRFHHIFNICAILFTITLFATLCSVNKNRDGEPTKNKWNCWNKKQWPIAVPAAKNWLKFLEIEIQKGFLDILWNRKRIEWIKCSKKNKQKQQQHKETIFMSKC